MNRIFSTEGAILRRGFFLFAALLLLAVPQAAFLPLIDRDEPRFAEASREMLQSGNFVVPTFNGAPRYAKPPLIYWAQAACFLLGGESAFTARLPSLLATAGTACLLYAWGFELAGASAALIAALAYALCLQTLQQGRVATADALLIFFITLTGYAGWKLLTLARNGKFLQCPWPQWGAALALGFGGGFLAKGPEALLPLLPLLFAARRLGPAILTALGALFLLGLLLVAAWAVPAFVETHGDYWREGLGHDVGDRMVSGFQGHGAGSLGWYLLGLPLYVLLFWLSALPWSPLLVTARRPLFRGWNWDETDLYLLGNAALFFAVFTLMVTKLPHYTLPAFPFLALLLGKRWSEAGLRPEGPVRTLLAVGLAFTLFALIVLPLLLAFVPASTPSPAGVLVREAGANLGPETKFAAVDFNEPTVIWEMRRVTRAFGATLPASGVDSFLREPGPRAVVLRSRTWQQLGLSDPAWTTFSARGWNAARLSGVDLTLVIKR